MVKKGTILFDIDRTLLDTDKLLRLQYRNISKIVNAASFKKFWDSTLTREKHINSEQRLNLICAEYNIKDVKLLSSVYYDEIYKYIYRDSVYPEARLILDKLKDKYKLGIYSEGTLKYQNHKFMSLGLQKYFDEEIIFIVPAKDTLEVIKKIPKGSIVIDDKEKICQFLTSNGIEAIWLNNKGDRKSDNFKTIFSLLELPAIL